MDSPRGRIALMAAVSEGHIPLNGAFEEHIRLCLACRACETACPSGVPYGDLVETARVALEQARTPPRSERLARRLALRHLLPHVGRLRVLARVLRVYQIVGLQRIVRRFDLLPEPIKTMEALLPTLPGSYADYAELLPAIGTKRGTVAFFHGCVQEAFLADVNRATIRVLRRNGFEVHVLPGQTCCGAAPLHVGEGTLARDLARRNVDAFANGKYDAIINNAGGCGATLKEYAHLLESDPAYRVKAERFAAAVHDVSEFLVARGFYPPTIPVSARATYVDSCHLRHAQGVVQPPRELLRAIPGLELIELQRPGHCCGSAGVYNITQPETATEILDDKMADVAATGADVIVTANTGCHMQMAYGVRRSGLDARVVHLVELLDVSYGTTRHG